MPLYLVKTVKNTQKLLNSKKQCKTVKKKTACKTVKNTSRDNRLSSSALPALVLLELFEASSPESSASLKTVVTLVRVLSDGD